MRKLIVAMSLIMGISMPAFAQVYPAAARVTEIHGDEITCTTATGFVYSFMGDDYYVDDIVSLIMDDNGTKGNIEDDKILDARYSGYWVNIATGNLNFY